MKEKIVGKIKNILYNTEKDYMEVTIKVLDKKFQKELLRNFKLAGKLKIEDEFLLFDEEADANI